MIHNIEPKYSQYKYFKVILHIQSHRLSCNILFEYICTLELEIIYRAYHIDRTLTPPQLLFFLFIF